MRRFGSLLTIMVATAATATSVVLWRSLETVSDSPHTRLNSAVDLQVLISGSSLTRLNDVSNYPTYEIVGLEVVRHSTQRYNEATGPTFDFPPLSNPEVVAGHALSGPITPVRDFEGRFLASLYVWSSGDVRAELPLWHVGWIARLGDGGDVTIYEGGEDRWDSELAEFATLLDRSDQAELLVDWIDEAMAIREGAEPGPITLAYAAAFLPPEEPPPPTPSLEVPLVINVEAPVSTDSIDMVLVRPGALVADEFVPSQRLLSEGSGSMTAIMLPEARMEIEVWDDDIPMSGTAIEFADWEAILSGGAGGVAISITQDERGTYSVTAEVLSIPEFNQALAKAGD